MTTATIEKPAVGVDIPSVLVANWPEELLCKNATVKRLPDGRYALCPIALLQVFGGSNPLRDHPDETYEFVQSHYGFTRYQLDHLAKVNDYPGPTRQKVVDTLKSWGF